MRIELIDGWHAWGAENWPYGGFFGYLGYGGYGGHGHMVNLIDIMYEGNGEQSLKPQTLDIASYSNLY